MNTKRNDTIIGYIIYKESKFDLIYRPSLSTSVCSSEWKIDKPNGKLIIGNIFKNNIYDEDIEPLIYHELYHLYFKSTNEYQADKFACEIVGYDKFEKCINKYCRGHICRLLNYRSSKIIHNSYCIYRLNAVKDTIRPTSDIENYKGYNLELI